MKIRTLVAFAALAVGSCGCEIHRVTTRQPVSGRVIDAQTLRAIVGADVRLSDYASNILATTQTTTEGTFHFAAVRERHFHIIGVPIEDYFPVIYWLEVDCAGYQASATRFMGRGGFGKPRTNNVPVELRTELE